MSPGRNRLTNVIDAIQPENQARVAHSKIQVRYEKVLEEHSKS